MCRSIQPFIRSFVCTLAGFSAAFAFCGHVVAVTITPPIEPTRAPVSTSDLWDASNGNQIISTHRTSFGGGPISPVAGFALSNIFGTSIGGFGGTILGPEGSGAVGGTIYTIDFMTPTVRTVRSFLLEAFHDGGGTPNNALAARRGISRMQLFAFNSGTGQFDLPLFDLNLDLDINPNAFGGPAESYDPQALLHPCGCFLNFRADVDQVVTTDRWRVEFTQFGFDGGSVSTPRIIELDGFENSLVPEPTSVILLAIGIFGSALVRSRKKHNF